MSACWLSPEKQLRLRLCESTVQRTAEKAGNRLGRLLAAGKTLDFPQPWDWHRNAKGRTCAYVSIDATGVRQQAEDEGPAEGRMPYVAWTDPANGEQANRSPI